MQRRRRSSICLYQRLGQPASWDVLALPGLQGYRPSCSFQSIRGWRMSAIVTVIEWLRARDKKRYGIWITHNTAKGAATDLLAALDEAGFVVVPKDDLLKLLARPAFGWVDAKDRLDAQVKP